MINPFNTKAIFSWNVPAFQGGDPDKFADGLADAGFEAVYLKAADGISPFKVSKFSPWPLWGENLRAELVSALHLRGIKAIGWGFNYGVDPVGEGKIAASQVNRLGLDGWIFDVESSFEQKTGAESNARAMVATYRQLCKAPVAFCSWARWHKDGDEKTAWHNKPMARAFMEVCDVGMPMMYWGGSTAASALALLNESMKQWAEFTIKPIVPVGRAYTGDGGTIDAAAISAFASEVHARHLPGISFWVLDSACKNADAWNALKSIGGFTPAPPTPPEPEPRPLTLEERVANLEKRVAALEEKQ